MVNVFLFLMAGALVISSPVLVLLSGGKPRAGDMALVITLPWNGDAADVAAGAGLQEIGPERALMGVLVVLDDVSSRDRLYDNGAWLVVDGRKILELCAN